MDSSANSFYDALNALVEEVERQAGARLPEKCDGAFVGYTTPNGEANVRTCYCNHFSMMVVPYEPAESPQETKKLKARGAGFARACAVCDSMGSWPRFESVPFGDTDEEIPF